MSLTSNSDSLVSDGGVNTTPIPPSGARHSGASIEVGLGLRSLAEDQKKGTLGQCRESQAPREVWRTQQRMAKILGYPARAAFHGMQSRSQRCFARRHSSSRHGESLCGSLAAFTDELSGKHDWCYFRHKLHVLVIAAKNCGTKGSMLELFGGSGAVAKCFEQSGQSSFCEHHTVPARTLHTQYFVWHKTNFVTGSVFP